MKIFTITPIFWLLSFFVVQSQDLINSNRLSKLHGEAFVRAKMIKTTSLTALQDKKQLTFNLFPDVAISATNTKNVEYREQSLLWHGVLTSGAQGYVELFSRKGRVSGTIYAGATVFKLDGLTTGELRVIELQPKPITDYEAHEEGRESSANKSLEASSRSQKTQNFGAATATNPSFIDVMIIYPPSVQESMGGAAQMENEVFYRIAEANEAFSNSNIYVEFRLVHHQVVNSVDEDVDDPDDVQTNEVEDLRDRYRADLVSFWNDDGTTGKAPNFDEFPGDFDDGYNTGKFSAVQSQYTFIHECGHNMGAKHDRQAYYEDSPTNSKLRLTPYYRYGKSFVGYRSIMSYSNCGELDGGSSRDCERVPYFTNPEITVNGAPFGVQGNFQTYDPNGPANNAQRINEVAPYVAAYYEDEDVVNVALSVTNGSGSGTYNEGSVVNISADTPEENRVFDQWTGDTDTVEDVFSANTTINISSQNLSIAASYRQDETLGINSYDLQPDFTVYPNPTKGILNLSLEENVEVSLDIINLSGQTKLSFQINGNEKNLDISALEAGFYIIKLSEGKKFGTKTFIKL